MVSILNGEGVVEEFGRGVRELGGGKLPPCPPVYVIRAQVIHVDYIVFCFSCSVTIHCVAFLIGIVSVCWQ